MRECGTASGRVGVPGPFGVLAALRKGFHAEGAERGADGGHIPPGSAEDAERGGEIAPPAHQNFVGVVDAEERCADTVISTRKAVPRVLRVSFLRAKFLAP